MGRVDIANVVSSITELNKKKTTYNIENRVHALISRHFSFIVLLCERAARPYPAFNDYRQDRESEYNVG